MVRLKRSYLVLLIGFLGWAVEAHEGLRAGLAQIVGES
jgi:hypothetical protein